MLSLQCPHHLWISGGTALKREDKTNSFHLPWESSSSAIKYRLLWMILFWQLEILTCVSIVKTIWKTKIMFSLVQCNKNTSIFQVDSYYFTPFQKKTNPNQTKTKIKQTKQTPKQQTKQKTNHFFYLLIGAATHLWTIARKWIALFFTGKLSLDMDRTQHG